MKQILALAALVLFVCVAAVSAYDARDHAPNDTHYTFIIKNRTALTFGVAVLNLTTDKMVFDEMVLLPPWEDLEIVLPIDDAIAISFGEREDDGVYGPFEGLIIEHSREWLDENTWRPFMTIIPENSHTL